jgi:hypothetical protein
MARLEQLPTELILECIKFLRLDPFTSGDTIKSLRLVSRRLCCIASPFLLHRVTVGLDSASLLRLEGLSRNELLAKGVTKVEINLSLYGAEAASNEETFAISRAEKLEADFEHFKENLEDWYDPMTEDVEYFWRAVIEDWYSFGQPDLTERESMTEEQQLLLRAYSQFSKRFADQEQVKEEAIYGDRIAAALASFPKLEAISIFDYNDRPQSLSFMTLPTENELMMFCVSKVPYGSSQPMWV